MLLCAPMKNWHIAIGTIVAAFAFFYSWKSSGWIEKLTATNGIVSQQINHKFMHHFIRIGHEIESIGVRSPVWYQLDIEGKSINFSFFSIFQRFCNEHLEISVYWSLSVCMLHDKVILWDLTKDEQILLVTFFIIKLWNNPGYINAINIIEAFSVFTLVSFHKIEIFWIQLLQYNTTVEVYRDPGKRKSNCNYNSMIAFNSRDRVTILKVEGQKFFRGASPLRCWKILVFVNVFCSIWSTHLMNLGSIYS